MGKKLVLGLVVMGCLHTQVASAEQLFDYKQLGFDTPRTGAETAFGIRFSDSRDFNCYRNGKVVFSMGVGEPSKWMRGGNEVASQYLKKYGTPLDWEQSRAYIRLEIGVETRKGYQPVYVGAGKPLFDSNESAKYMVVELFDGKRVEFTRFDPTPEFPFNTKKKLKPFFYYQVAGEPRYECGAIDQPD
jgi:hypothetical protein